MKVPNNISHLLRRRATLAATLMEVDYKIAEWLDKKGVEVEDYDIRGGVEIYTAPYSSAERIKRAIEKVDLMDYQNDVPKYRKRPSPNPTLEPSTNTDMRSVYLRPTGSAITNRLTEWLQIWFGPLAHTAPFAAK